MSLPEDSNPIVVLSRSLLASIKEITALVEGIEIEQEIFMQVACYLERTSPAIMELQISKYPATNSIEVLQLLSRNVDLAKELLKNCGSKTSYPELKKTIEQLETVIRNIGQGLGLIPSSTFEKQQYAEVAVRSLSQEMQNAEFQVAGVQILESEDQKEHDLYPINFEERDHQTFSEIKGSSLEIETTTGESQTFDSDVRSDDMPRLVDFLRGMNYGGKDSHTNSSKSFKSLPQLAEYMEPLYDTFFCPLTKKIMEDPVTVGSGVTYERSAITEWFKKFQDRSEEITCPTTGQKLESKVLNTNIALKITIEEWKERNEATRIKVARAALSLASSESMVMEALKDLQILCRRKQSNKVQMRNVGMIPLLVQFLDNEDRKVRKETLKTLLLLAEDDEGKEIIANTKAIPVTIKMLSSDYQVERHSALSLLLELSTSELLCKNIGSVPGAILLLITMKYDESIDAFASEKADKILINLERYPKNIKRMAENGLLDPLLNHLIEGSEELQMEAGSYLGEIILGHDSKMYVAQRASASLIRMVHNGNTVIRKAAFKSLVQISSYHPNSKTLVNEGIVPIMTEEMFTRKIYNEPMNSKEESAEILANILESGPDLETLQVNTHGHTMASDYVVYNIIHMLKNSMPDKLNINLIRVLLCLMKSPKAAARVVTATKETEASYKLIELIDATVEELSIVSTKLLISLSPHMGHTLADRLCKTGGQPENLIKKLETDRITEKHAAFTTLLSKIPHKNLTLNLALLHKDIVPTVLQKIDEIQRGVVRTTRFSSSYLEGLVGILVRFTTTLYDREILFLAKNLNFTAVFTELLMRSDNDEVQRLSAIGLENLSAESIHLSKTPQIKKPKSFKYLSRCFSHVSSQNGDLHVCPVHRGECSSQGTFCLIESRALEKLLSCLDHENVAVVEAALSAICTLLDDKVDVDRSVNLLNEVNVVQHVLNVLREHRQETIWQKSFWVIERFLMRGGQRSISDISQDRLLPSTLVSAFHHGDSNTRQMAEKILKHLNKIPSFSSKVVL